MNVRFSLPLVAALTACGNLYPEDPSEDFASSSTTATVSVSGRVTFDFIPHGTMTTGLDYDATERRPARGVTVQLVADDRTIGATITDEDGRYRLDAAPGTDAVLRLRAELGGETRPTVQVLNNTLENAPYVLDSDPFTLPETDTVHDLHAASGWTGSGYATPRAAAPFAILDVVFEAMQWVRTVDPEVQFAPLDVLWSPQNTDISGADIAGAEPDYAAGRAGGTHYRPAAPDTERRATIYLLGAENEDTDEYDRAVIAHEWMHYFLDTLSRDDSPGGRHALGEQLDLRVAFSEGVATALAAVMLRDGHARYSLGPQQAYGGSISLEELASPHPGWFSESSVIAIAYDLLDPGDDGSLVFGFDEIYEVFVNDLRETPALTSLFAFTDALKRRHPDRAHSIDTLLAQHSIEPVADAFGSTETNAGHPPNRDTLPVYARATVNGGTVNVCSTDDFRTAQPQGNGLGVWRFVRFAATVEGRYTISATATTAPRGQRADPVLGLHSTGYVGGIHAPPNARCQAGALPYCTQRMAAQLPVQPGDNVIEVAEATNANQADGRAPVGRTCFDIEVTGP